MSDTSEKGTSGFFNDLLNGASSVFDSWLNYDYTKSERDLEKQRLINANNKLLAEQRAQGWGTSAPANQTNAMSFDSQKLMIGIALAGLAFTALSFFRK